MADLQHKWMLMGTTRAHSWLSLVSSYQAEGTGALVPLSLLVQLATYLYIPSPHTVTHYCKNQGLVKQVNYMKSTTLAW